MDAVSFQAARPTALKPRLESIPHELREISNWVLWKYEPPKKPDGKWQKVPHQPNGYKASTTNRRTWSTFETCRAVYEQGGYDGVGFVFDGAVGPDGTCLVGIDLDRCMDTDKSKIQHFALERIKRLDTYTEASPSGTGLHLIARTEPVRSIKTKEVEIYTTARYFTFTGRKWDEESPIRIATAEVRALIAEVRAQEVAPAFAGLDPSQGLGAGIKDYWFDQLQPEQKDEAVDYALGVITNKTNWFETEDNGGNNDQWYRLTTSIARSGAPHAEDIFVKHASTAADPDPEDALREKFTICQKAPPPKYEKITVGTLLGLALEHGADFDKWKQPKTLVPPNLVLTLADWEARDLPAPDHILGSVIATTTRMLLAADTGIGKTLFALAVGMRGAQGCGFLHWTGIRPARVLYIDGEMSNRQLKQRLAEETLRMGVRPTTFFALSREDIPGMQPLNTHAGQMLIEEIIREHCGGNIDLIQFDNIMALISGNHSEEEGWAKTMPWILNLTQRAIGQMWIHHTGHDTSRQYGTKTREWQMDAYAQFDKVQRDDTDVSFLLTFRKARERTPGNRLDFADTRISLVNNNWTHEKASDAKRAKLSPAGQKYFEVLRELQGQSDALFKTVSRKDWQEACNKHGLTDSANSSAIFNKYRRELIDKNWIACSESAAWVLE